MKEKMKMKKKMKMKMKGSKNINILPPLLLLLAIANNQEEEKEEDLLWKRFIMNRNKIITNYKHFAKEKYTILYDRIFGNT